MSTVLEQIQTYTEQINDLKSKLIPLYHSLLSEEATKMLGVPLTCKEISITIISHEKKINTIEFVDENGKTYAKCVELCNSDLTGEMKECRVKGMNSEDAESFMIDMICAVDWTFFE